MPHFVKGYLRPRKDSSIMPFYSQAEQTGGGKKSSKADFVPYRDSVLTWLLKDSLGGNSKTTMLAALSPADINYDETLSTLRFLFGLAFFPTSLSYSFLTIGLKPGNRYADRAKQIVNKAVVNEDANAKMIRELKEELDRLKTQLLGGFAPTSEQLKSWKGSSEGGFLPFFFPSISAIFSISFLSFLEGSQPEVNVADQIQANEKLMAELNQSWEQKLEKTKEIQKTREVALEEMGIAIKEGEKGAVGLSTPQKLPHLINLNEDPLMSECLIYYIKEGVTRVGTQQASVKDPTPDSLVLILLFSFLGILGCCRSSKIFSLRDSMFWKSIASLSSPMGL